jgi:hypothetical protein
MLLLLMLRVLNHCELICQIKSLCVAVLHSNASADCATATAATASADVDATACW